MAPADRQHGQCHHGVEKRHQHPARVGGYGAPGEAAGVELPGQRQSSPYAQAESRREWLRPGHEVRGGRELGDREAGRLVPVHEDDGGGLHRQRGGPAGGVHGHAQEGRRDCHGPHRAGSLHEDRVNGFRLQCHQQGYYKRACFGERQGGRGSAAAGGRGHRPVQPGQADPAGPGAVGPGRKQRGGGARASHVPGPLGGARGHRGQARRAA
mmetsp:Transcript_30774/g.98277  ORF Transcript_30774/g.98277 Transcript_30774/m.98277 type:complete len:211 (+) Transcript_30774:258-890(+)